MTDGERFKEKKKNKRARDEANDRLDRLPSFKKINIDYSEPADGELNAGASSSSSDDSNPPTESSVFDFPWLKEGTTVKSDLKIDDIFASSLDATNVSEIIEAGDVSAECGSGSQGSNRSCEELKRKEMEVVREDDDDGLESVWDSLLNQQPLSNIEF